MGFVMICSFSSVNAQLPWTEDFSDNNNEGVTGSCGAAPTSCNYYSAPSDFTLSGTYSGLQNSSDWFYVYLWGGDYWLEARDVDSEVCYTSNTITASGDIDFEIDLREWGNLENSDYISVYLIIDGTPALVQTLNNDFGTTTVSAYGVSVTSNVAVNVCFLNNSGGEYQAIDEIRITQACNPPVASCQDITVALVNGSATITTNDIDNGSTYECGLQSMTLSQTSFDCNDIGANTVTLTVTDNNSDSDQCTATVTVTGSNNPPVANCQDMTVNLSGGSATITANDIDNGSTADCGISSISLDITNFDCNDIGANTVTLTVEDNIGQQSTCTATVTVNDPGTPTAVCQDITVNLDCSGNASITANDINNGSTAPCGINSTSLDITSFTTADIGDNTVTLTVEDNASRTDQCTATVTVTNTNGPPVAICQDITVDMGCSSSVTITANDIDNGSTYDCGLSSMTLDQYTFNSTGVYTVTLTVEDNYSQTDQCTAEVTVTSSGGTAPVFNSCPSDDTQNNDSGNCTAIYTYTVPTAPDVTVSGFDENYEECFWTITEDDGSDVDMSGAPGSVLFTSADNGNWFQYTDIIKTMTCDATISFDWDYTVDTYGFALYDPFYYYLNGWVYWITDPWSGDQSGTISINVSAGDDFGIGIYTLDGQDGPAVTDVTNFSVVEATTVTLTSGLASGAAFPVGTTTVEYTASSCGGSSTCSFDVTIVDVEDPTISCPSNITNRDRDSGQCYATVNSIAATYGDNCPSSSVAYTLTGATTGSGTGDASGTQFNPGTTTVTYTVTDNSGNTNSCNFTVQVNEMDVHDYNAGVCPVDAGAVNLDEYNDDVTSESGTIVWYHDAGLTNPVAGSPPVVSVSDGDNKYFELTETGTGCTADAKVVFDVDVIHCILPVELQNFNGKVADCKNVLSWTSASEELVSHFEIEKSKDGFNFETIGEVLATGNLNGVVNYLFTDEYVSSPNNYYRLRMIDFDGNFQHSEIIHLQSGCFDDIKIIELFPNPVKSNHKIILKFETTQPIPNTVITTYDIFGRPISSATHNIIDGENTIPIRTENMIQGIYFLNIRNEKYNTSLPFTVIQD